MGIYVQIGGSATAPDIKGNVTAAGFDKQIEASSFQFGTGRAISMAVGRGDDRETSAPSLSEVALTKTMDDSSVHLFESSLMGTSTNVVITIVKSGPTELQKIVQFTLTDALISGYSVSTGGETPSESLSLSFTKIEMKYFQYGADHKQSGQVPFAYDLKTAKKA